MRRQAVHHLSSLIGSAVLLIACASPLHGQQPEAKELLARALHLADLCNWADAAPAFTQAEELFTAAGDRRNALYAKLGRIRSNIERDQQTLPMVSAQLAEVLDDDPLLQTDKHLRMFCLIVKGDIDTETHTGAMREDWAEVQALAQQLGDVKWQYRALAQLGIAAFYDANLETARKNVGSALAAAEKAGDVGAQIRFLTILTNALLKSKMYEQALAYAENAIKMAAGVPDAGYQFPVQELRIEALIGLEQFDAAQRVADELLMRAHEARRSAHEATALGLAADIASARNDRPKALVLLDQTIALAETSGLTRLLAGLHTRSADIHRKNGDLEKAERSAELAAASTQASGDVWAVPQRLQTLAQLQIARGRHAEADGVYDRAEAFVDSMIGKATTAFEKTAVITASSQIYSEHFSLVADHFNDPKKAYKIIEQVRGRVATDLLVAGATSTPAAKTTEPAISQLRLKLMAARSTDQVRALRDQIFMAEQARWISPGVSVLKTRSSEPVAIEQVQRTLAPSVLLLEYVLANPSSYCLVISRHASRIVQLKGMAEIEPLIAAYLEAVKAKMPALAEARGLYDALIRPAREVAAARTLVIVRDGRLHLVPFDGLRGPSGRYVAEGKTVLYSPSATTFYLLMQEKQRPRTAHRRLLAVGGIPYRLCGWRRFSHRYSRTAAVGDPPPTTHGASKVAVSMLSARDRPSEPRWWPKRFLGNPSGSQEWLPARRPSPVCRIVQGGHPIRESSRRRGPSRLDGDPSAVRRLGPARRGSLPEAIARLRPHRLVPGPLRRQQPNREAGFPLAVAEARRSADLECSGFPEPRCLTRGRRGILYHHWLSA